MKSLKEKVKLTNIGITYTATVSAVIAFKPLTNPQGFILSKLHTLIVF